MLLYNNIAHVPFQNAVFEVGYTTIPIRLPLSSSSGNFVVVVHLSLGRIHASRCEQEPARAQQCLARCSHHMRVAFAERCLGHSSQAVVAARAALVACPCFRILALVHTWTGCFVDVVEVDRASGHPFFALGRGL